jgi:hypothetical protein
LIQTKSDTTLETAQELLQRLRSAIPTELPTLADELLRFLNRLKDDYVIVESTSRSMTGQSFAVLQAVVYDLESAPVTTMRNEAMVEFLRTLLEEIIRGTLVIQKRESILTPRHHKEEI